MMLWLLLAAWIPVSLLVGLFVGAFIRVGSGMR